MRKYTYKISDVKNMQKELQNKQKETITPLFFEGFVDYFNFESEENVSEFQLELLEKSSNMNNECVYVIDLLKQNFILISNHELFLRKHSPDEIKLIGYDYFLKIIHPEDVHLFILIHRIMLKYLFDLDSNPKTISYFSFNLRLLNNGLTLWINHKMTPFYVNGHLRMAIFQLFSSIIQKTNSLEIYYNNQRKKYSSYSFEKKLWEQKKILNLTNREKEILKLAMQGMSSKEIADVLCITSKTIRNMELALYQKMNVHSMLEAVIFTTNHQLLFV